MAELGTTTFAVTTATTSCSKVRGVDELDGGADADNCFSGETVMNCEN